MELTILLIIFELVLGASSWFFFLLYRKEKGEKERIWKERCELASQKKSTEVRTGFLVEQFAPFISTFPGDAKQTRFLGQPIDFISFGNEEILFIEVKSGHAKLSAKQSRIQQLVEQGKVKFKTMQINI